MAQDRQDTRQLRRGGPRKVQRTRFVIICEGEVTEPKYLKELARRPSVREVATLDIRGMGREPRRLVEEARDLKRSERGQTTGATQYWCVCSTWKHQTNMNGYSKRSRWPTATTFR